MNSFKDVSRSCYTMKNYVRNDFSDGVERFDGYDEFMATMFRITEDLSEDIISQIFEFIEENIEQLVFDTDNVFAESEAVCEANNYNIETEDEFIKMAAAFYSVLWELEEKIDNFFMQIIKQEIDNDNLIWEPSHLFAKEVN